MMCYKRYGIVWWFRILTMYGMEVIAWNKSEIEKLEVG